ncbi:MAG: FAD-binding domain-containing protein [Acidimicrobiales bacterium]
MARPTTALAPPAPGVDAAEAFVAEHLSHLCCDDVAGSENWRGGQRAADAALASFDVTGYAAQRNEVYPVPKRGASGLSPFIRHGLLSLDQVWNHVGGGPGRDVDKFRDELLWQEYARHWYARLGSATRAGVRHQPPAHRPTPARPEDGWDTDMACFELTVEELLDDGWLVNQSRMWLASHWTVRQGHAWQDGEDVFFRHLLDGSRAANRLGWQWTTGAGSSKAYGFSRWQVEKRAPGLCASCDLVHDCPIESWPGDPDLERVDPPADLRSDTVGDTIAGPGETQADGEPDIVWLTAESLGDRDPALEAHPDLPAVFVFDEPLLARLRLSSKRLVFLVETLAELAEARDITVHLGDPVGVFADHAPAVTFAPVPGFRDRAARIGPAELHPYRWLVRPQPGNLASFSAWRRSVKL